MEKLLKDLWDVRSDKLYEKGIDNISPEYHKILHCAIGGIKLLEESLCPDRQKVLIDLLNDHTKLEMISNSIFYLEGLKDGLKLLTKSTV